MIGGDEFSTGLWFAVGTVYGFFSAIHLVAPEFFNNIPGLVFGRTRPIHVNTVVFGFATSTLVGSALYFVPALLRTRLWSERLGWFSFACWTGKLSPAQTQSPWSLPPPGLNCGPCPTTVSCVLMA